MDSTPPAAPPPRRWLRRTAICAGAALVIAALVFHFAVMPWLVRQNVEKALAGLGIAGARFDVKRAWLWRSTVTNITSADGTIRGGSLDVTYRPIEVLSGKLRGIVIEAAEVRVSFARGERTQPDSGGASVSPNLPFRKLEIRSSTLVLEWNGQMLRLPVTGVIDHDGNGTLSGRAAVSAKNDAVTVELPGVAKLHAPGGVLNLVDATLDGSVSFRPGSTDWRLNVRAHNGDGIIMLTVPTIEANLGRVGLTASASGRTGQSSTVKAELSVDGAAIKHASSELSLAGISLRLPVWQNVATTPRPTGSMEVASVILNRQRLEPINGTVAVHDGRAEFSAKWVALPDSLLSVNGWLARGEDGLDGLITANLPTAQLDDADALVARIPALAGWAVTGKIGGDGELRFERGKPSGQVTVSVANADAASKAADVELHDVNGAVTVNLADVVSTPPGQTIRAARAAFPKVELTEASLTFQQQSPDALLIQHLAAGWLGGRVSTSGVRINPADPKFEATLVADRLSLRELLVLAAPGRASGEGLMSGRVAVNVAWPDDVTFGKGVLRSVSPSGGEIQVLDTKWLGDVMDQSDARFTAAGELAVVKDRVLAALGDFSYDRLSFSFEEEPETGGLLRAETYGKGRVGERPQEIGLTLNFRGVNKLTKPALKMREWWQRLTNPELK